MPDRYIRKPDGLYGEDVAFVDIGNVRVRRVRQYKLEQLTAEEQVLQEALNNGEVAVRRIDSRGRPGFVVFEPGHPAPTWLTLSEKKD